MLLRLIFFFAVLGVLSPAQARRVHIQSGDLRLQAEYRSPTQAGMPAVLMLHGCGGLYTATGDISSRMQRMGNLLQEMGYGVLYLDSFTPRGIRQTCTPRSAHAQISALTRANDAEAAIHWLRRQKEIDKNRIGVLGWSHGADGVLDLLGRNNRAIKVAVTYYPACRSIAKQNAYRVSAPTLVLIGDADVWTPAQDCKQLAAATGQDLFHVVTYPGVLHDFDAPVANMYAQNDIPNRARSADTVFSAPDSEAAHDANRRTFKWFARWFDPERTISGAPPSTKDAY